MNDDRDIEIRDRLWREVWSLEYDTAYAHESAKFMVRRWMKLDLSSRLLAALFTSGSAVAGWAFWSTTGWGRTSWMFLAGAAAVIAIVDGVLGSRQQIKRYSELSGSFVRLMHSLRGVLSDMRIDPKFDVQKVRTSHEETRSRYAELLETYPEDLFFTDSNANAIQDLINQRREYANQDNWSTTETEAASATPA
ncbi:MAG: hypothetical protein ACN4GG_10900 [Akkermansiaceae bacterium]